MAINFLNQVALANARVRSAACRINSRDDQPLIVSVESITRSCFRGQRLDSQSKLRVPSRAGAAGAFIITLRSLPVGKLRQCDLEVLIERDTKGLYKRALLPDGHPDKVYNLTGINDAYETPADADLVIDTGKEPLDASVRRVFEFVTHHALRAIS